MDSCALPLSISALAVAIAKNLPDDELELTAVILTQLADTLATIAVQRAICNKLKEKAESDKKDAPTDPDIVIESILAFKKEKKE